MAKQVSIGRRGRRPPRQRDDALEPAYWRALVDIGRRESLSLPDLCRFIRGRDPDRPFATAVRLFVMQYLRAAVDRPPVTPEVAA